jgi:hypothetical protein
MIFSELIKKHPSPAMHQHLCKVFAELDHDEMTIRIQEFLKFIYIQSMQDGGFIPVSDEVDQIWHEYILQTREYQALCLDLPGGKFVHHQTITLVEYANHHKRVDVVKSMLNWIPNYCAYFGEFTEKTAHYWMIVEFLSKELDLTLEQINHIGKKVKN